MKTKLQTLFCMMLLMLTICSCNSYDQKKADVFVDKLITDQKLTQEEYSEALDIAILGAEEIVSEYSKLDISSSSYRLDKLKIKSELGTPVGQDKLVAIYFIDSQLTSLQKELNFRNLDKLKKLNQLVAKVRKYWNGENIDVAQDEEEACVETIDEHEYVDLGLSVYWAKYNIGRTEESDGDLIVNKEIDVKKKWGGNWRIPKISEIDELIENCTKEYIDKDGKKTNSDDIFTHGIRFTSKKNGASIDIQFYWNDGLGVYAAFPDVYSSLADNPDGYDFINNELTCEPDISVMVRPVKDK